VSNINIVLQKFWEVDSSAVEVSPISCENKRILEHTQSTIQLVDGRYRISIPWKEDRMVLPDSYQETICKYLEKGYIKEIVQTESTSMPKWYLPHFAIAKPGRTTTKIRIVFDASAKCNGMM